MPLILFQIQAYRKVRISRVPETGLIARVLKLCFVNVEIPNDPLYTGYPLQWKNGENAMAEIFQNEMQITHGDLSKLQIKIL